jgi:hypothetical protein
MKHLVASAIVFVGIQVSESAFLPVTSNIGPKSSLAFGFLKDLGLEKPSWLPDFGGNKEKGESSDDNTKAEAPTEKKEDVEVPSE